MLTGSATPHVELNAAAYRDLVSAQGFVSCRILEGETDMLVCSPRPCAAEARQYVHAVRQQVVDYIAAVPHFRHSLAPLPDDPGAPTVVRRMLRAGIAAGVGPMAAVAGAIAHTVGERLARQVGEVTAENGGDVFLRTDGPQHFCIVAETSPAPLVHIRVEEDEPGSGMGVCTSSGRLGHSFSYGNADAVTIVAPDTALADALATAAANRVCAVGDIPGVLGWALERGASGIVIVAFGQVAAQGAIRFCHA